jgi:uncharacterized membrane-anchored protein YhcB (DUF1043 family)
MRDAWALFVVGIVCGALFARALAPAPARADTRARDTLRIVERQLDTLYQTRRVRYDSVLTRYVTLRVTDTLMRADTIYVRRELADSLVASCQSLIITCEQRVANARAQTRLADAAWQRAERRARWLPYAATAGVILGVVIAK